MQNSKMMDAFIKQTYGSPEKMEEAQYKADQREADIESLAKHHEQLAITEMCKDQSFKSTVNIPSKLKDGELNQKTESHPKLKNYDHSLEMGRSSKLGLINLKEENTGSVEDMFNSMFN